MSNLADFGVVGLAVMGRSLAQNLADRGLSVAIYNREPELTDDLLARAPAAGFVASKDLAAFVASIAKPRRILAMIKAGAPVDDLLDKLAPLLDEGDVVIDGGNTHYAETERREKAMAARGIRFVGMGVSGGEEGARRGPSLMPGGPAASWELLRPVLESIAARTEAGPCVTHVGPGGAGHFVKMVHNGIEYGDMQLIAEVYDLATRGAGLTAGEAADVFSRWNEGPLASFLIEITAEILRVEDPKNGGPLVEQVLDQAGQKGTGRWTVELGLELGVPIPTIAAAIDARVVSSRKAERVAAAERVRGVTLALPAQERDAIVSDLGDALLATKIASYAQGMRLLAAASERFGWGLRLDELCRIWKGGCIIRARLLDPIRAAYQADPALPSLLLDPTIEGMLATAQPGLRRAVARAVGLGIPVPALGASLAWFDGVRTARLPQNLTQAQRDAFGAHTYERVDQPGVAVHTPWLGEA